MPVDCHLFSSNYFVRHTWVVYIELEASAHEIFDQCLEGPVDGLLEIYPEKLSALLITDDTYFWYIDGFTFTINSASSPHRTMCTISLFGLTSVCKNETGRSTVATSLFSNTAMVAVVKRLYVATVGEATSSLIGKTFLGPECLYMIFPSFFHFVFEMYQ